MLQRVIVGVIGLVAIGGGLYTLFGPGQSNADKAARIERDLLADPINGPFMAEFKQLLPAEYAAIVPPLLARAVDDPEAAKAFDATFLQKMQAFQAEHVPAMAGAETAVLAEFAGKQRDVMQTPRLCEAMLADTPQSLDPADAEGRKTVVARDIALLRAVASGRQHGIKRGEPTEEQDIAFSAQMEPKLTPAQVAALTDGSVASMSAHDRCPIVAAYWTVIAGLPSEESANWTAFLLLSEAG